MARRSNQITVQALAEAAGISPQAVGKNSSVIRNEDGSVDQDATMNLAQIREQTERESLRKERALADKHEMEAAQKRGDLIEVSKVEEEWGRVCSEIRDAMLAIPDRVSPRATGLQVRELREVLMVEIRKALGTLADQVKQAA